MLTPRDQFAVWSVAKLKGGLRGTTTAWFIATYLAKLGHSVGLVDADKTAQSATDWAIRAEAAGLDIPFAVIQWTPAQGILPGFVRRVADQHQPRYLVVDVEPTASMVEQAAAVSDLMVLPTGVDAMELTRIVETDQTAAAVNPRLPRPVLLTRVPAAGKGRAKEARKVLDEYGLPVLGPEVPQDRERYADVFGSVVTDVGVYADVADELIDSWGRCDIEA